MKKMKKQNRGFTLIELLVSFAILAIVITLSSTLIFSSYQNLDLAADLNDDKLVADEVFAFIKQELAFAGNVQILAQDSLTTPAYARTLAVKDGHLLLNNRDIYENIYHGRTLRLTVNAYNEDNLKGLLDLRLDMLDEAGNVTYYVAERLRVNLLAKNSSKFFEGEVGVTLQNPQISYDGEAIVDGDLSRGAQELYANMRYGTRDAWFKIVNDPTLTAAQKSEMQKRIFGQTYANNEAFRTYLVNNFYSGSWPLFPRNSDGNYTAGHRFNNGQDYYMKAYIHPANNKVDYGLDGTNPTVIVYAQSDAGMIGWYTNWVFDIDELAWYSGPGMSINNQPWSAVKEKIHQSSWKKYEFNAK